MPPPPFLFVLGLAVAAFSPSAAAADGPVLEWAADRPLLAQADQPARPSPAPGAPVSYRVEVEAPRDVRDLLQQALRLVRWQDDPQMSAELLQRLTDEAVTEAAEALATLGYFSARVRAEIDRSATPWTVRLYAEPGERTTVKEVDLAITGPAAEDPEAQAVLRRIRREWTLRAGEPFTQQAWEDAKRDAVRKLSAWRYAAASVATSEARIDPAARSAALKVRLDSGPPFRFGAVEVTGGKRYPDEVVANLNPAQPGDTYDRNVLALYERRLLETGYFVSARADVQPDPLQASAAPVRATVIEGSSQQIETGLSFNTDFGTRLELRYRDVDLLDSAWRARTELRLDRLTQQARIDLDTPPRPGATWRNYFVNVRDATVQNETNAELAFGLSHNWAGGGATPSSLITSAHFEEQRLDGVPIDNRHAVYFGFRRALRDTDDLVSPRRGYIGVFTAGGSPARLSSQEFARVTLQLQLLIPLGRANDVVLRGEGGAVLAASREGIPSSFLFRTGGDQTVRGYAFESLGVRRGNAVVGGRYLAIGSAEITHWFAESWGLAAFVDAGNAWDSGGFQPAVGVGLGARFRTPIGPIRADVAYGDKTGSLRLHFSVGFAF